jgi:hypothetical protein
VLEGVFCDFGHSFWAQTTSTRFNVIHADRSIANILKYINSNRTSPAIPRLRFFTFHSRDLGPKIWILEAVDLLFQTGMHGRSKLLWRHDASTSPDELGRSIGPLLNLSKPWTRNSHLISVELADFGTAGLPTFTETKFSRVELKDRATIRGVSRGQRCEQRQRRFDPALNRTYEPINTGLMDKWMLNATGMSAGASGVRPLAAVRMSGRNPWLIRIISARTIGALLALPLGAQRVRIAHEPVNLIGKMRRRSHCAASIEFVNQN